MAQREKRLRSYTLETMALHAGQAPDPTTGSRAVPIYQTSSYVFHNTDHAAQLFALDEPGNIYSRIGNPTNDVLEKRIAAMEGGVAGVAFSSGMAGLHNTILNLTRTGDEIVAADSLYGGSYTLFTDLLPEVGIHAHLVDADDPDNLRRAITPRTKLIFAETIGNPRLDVLDIAAVAKVAHEAEIPLVIDNTFATPYLCRPIEWGADIVIHSATKWLGGHGTSIGGLVVDGGRFDWSNGNFPRFTEPDESYHGVRYASDFGTLAFSTKLRAQYLRNTGGSLSPFNAFLILQGVETLHVRMQRHCENAQAIAEHLTGHPSVEWVTYPGLPDHFSHKPARKYLENGFGSMLNFGIKGGEEAGMRFIDRVNLWSHLANVGDAKSLVIHPASTTHQQLTPEQQVEAGVAPDLIRCSVGIEGVTDLIEDLDQAIEGAVGVRPAGGPTASTNNERVIRWVCQDAYETVNDDMACNSAAEGDTHRVRSRPKRIAVVGLSNNPARPSYRVARKMQRMGYRIIPVNPHASEILDEPAYPDLASVPGSFEIVQLFRSSEHAAEVARQAAQIAKEKGIRVFWLQEGVLSDEAIAIAAEAGLDVVSNRCTYKEAQRLRGAMATFSSPASSPSNG